MAIVLRKWGLRLSVLLVTVLVCIPLGIAHAQPLSGEVMGVNNDPKVGARVQLSEEGGPRRYIVVTGPEGQFTIPRFAAGRYVIRVRQGDNAQQFLQNITKADPQSNEKLLLRVRW